jgi:uncharacterized membrane protein YkoI
MTGFAALFASALAVAVPIGIAAAQPANPPAGGNPGQPDMKAALAAFEKAKISLTDAIATGEQQGGGKAVDATFGGGPTSPAYRVTIYRNKTLWENLYDANTGKPVGQPNTIPESQLDEQEKAELAGIDQAKTTLAQAVKAAEQQGGGKAIDARIEQRGGKMSYEIAIVKSGNVQPMTVDPMTGTASVATSPPDQPKQQ